MFCFVVALGCELISTILNHSDSNISFVTRTVISDFGKGWAFVADALRESRHQLVVAGAAAWCGGSITGYRLLGFFWFGLILVQAGLGAWTIWSNKAADVATAHVVVGALSLVTGALASIISLRQLNPAGATNSAEACFTEARPPVFSAPPANS